MFSPPSHPFSPPNPSYGSSSSSAHAWRPTTSTTDDDNHNTQGPPRTVERKRRAYPYAFESGPEMIVDPITGLPTPAQTGKRDKTSTATRTSRMSDEGQKGNANISDSPPPPSPTPGTTHPAFMNGPKGKSLTYMSSAYGGIGLLTPEQDVISGFGSASSSGEHMGASIGTGSGAGGLEVDQILGGTFGRKRRAGLTFAQQMGLLSSSSSSCSSAPPSSASSSGPSTLIAMPASGVITSHTRHLSLPHSSPQSHQSICETTGLLTQTQTQSIFGQGIGIGMGMRGHHKAKQQNQKRGGKKSSVDSVHLGGAFRLNASAAGSGSGSIVMPVGAGGGRGEGERLLGPAKILLDNGSNPFLIEDEDDEMGIGREREGQDGKGQDHGSDVTPRAGAKSHVGRLLFGVRKRVETSRISTLDQHQDVDMDGDFHSPPNHQQQRGQHDEDEEEEEGDYEIESPQPPLLTSTSEASSDSMTSPDTTPTDLNTKRGLELPVEGGEVVPATPDELTPIAGLSKYAHEGSGGCLRLGSMVSPQGGSRLSTRSPYQNKSTGNACDATHTPSARRPSATTSFQPVKRVWPKPTFGSSGADGAQADDEENPFLVGPGRKGKVMSSEERERRRLEAGKGERETISYVFRGTKTQFANPYYHLATQSTPRTSKLDPGHMDFSPVPLPKPRLLWKEAHVKVAGENGSGSGSGRGGSGFGSGSESTKALTSEASAKRCLGGSTRKLGLNVDGDEEMIESDDEASDGAEDHSLTAKPARRLLFGSATLQKEQANGSSSQPRRDGSPSETHRGIKHERSLDTLDVEGCDGLDTPRDRKRMRTGLDSF